jgi:hypothetical protein
MGGYFFVEMNKKKLVLIILIFILTNIASAVIGYYTGKGLDFVNSKPSMDIIMPQTYEPEGSFNIVLSNGDVDLTDVQANVQSCYMESNKWKHYPLYDLPKNKEKVIKFEDELTLNKSLTLDCKEKPLEGWEKRTTIMKIYKNTTSGEFIVPNFNNTIRMCGLCYWNISVTSDQKNFSFYKEMFLPVGLMIEGIGVRENWEEAINSPDVVYYSDIRITFFGQKELEIEGEFD